MIRDATRDDIPALQDLYRHLIPDEEGAAPEVAAEKLTALKAYVGSTILMAFKGDQPVATVTLIVVPNMTRQGAPYAFIENVVTHSDYRGRGYAKSLLTEAETRAWKAGCYRIMIVSGNHNSGARIAYTSAGYAATKTGFQKRKIPDRGES